MSPVEELYAENIALKEENAHLQTQIAWLRKQLFGGGKGEQLDRSQLLLKLGELEKLAASSKPTQQIAYERTARAEARPLPAEAFANLPVKETIEIIPEPVKADPSSYEKIGEERTFEVDVIPPKLVKREIVRPKYRHRSDRAQAPLLAPAPARAVAGGYASAGLLAWIALSKYVDHLPLYRLEQMSSRWGATIPRQSMADWVRITAEWLEPIYRQMHRNLLTSGYIQADETPIRCNDPDVKRGGTSQGWLWAISAPDDDVVFHWRLSRRHDELPPLLAGFLGVLQSDGYEAYPSFVKDNPGVSWVGCWAHARRKFFDAQQQDPKLTRVALKLIASFYRLEREWDKAGILPAERARCRTARFARNLGWLRELAVKTRERVLPKSLLGRASTYLLGHWQPLVAHQDHGQTRIDNNLIENAIRPSAIGKKNWLFIGHPDAGDRSAIIYSIVVSCQRHGKDPHAYLRDVLTRLPAMTNRDDLSALTPKNWKAPLS